VIKSKIATTATCVDVMMIGHMAKDEVIVDGQGQTVPGGGVYYGGIALRTWAPAWRSSPACILTTSRCWTS